MREIEKPLEALGIEFWSSRHDYCGEHPPTHACYSPLWCFKHRGHHFEINECKVKGKWVVYVDAVHYLASSMDDVVKCVANITPRVEESEE